MFKNKVIYAFVMVIVVIISYGCRSHSAPSDPDAGSSSTSDYDYIVLAQFHKGNNHTLNSEIFAVVLMNGEGVTVTASTITLTGPTGVIGLQNSTGGIMYYSDDVHDKYIHGGLYSVSFTVEGSTYTGTIIPPGELVIAADGSSVSWPFSSAMTSISVRNPDWNSQSYGPFINSPFDVNATGIYSYGAGEYSIYASVTKMEDGFMPYPRIGSTYVCSETKWVDVIK